MTWIVLPTETGEVHVMPCDGSGEQRDMAHRFEGCWCQPRVLRDGPLADAVISHRAPEHPGAEDRLV